MNTIDDIKKLELHDPIVRAYMQHVQHGNMTMEQALIGMVVSLSSAKKEVEGNYINSLKEEKDSFQRVGIKVQEENEQLKAKLKLANEELEYIFGREGWLRIRDVLEKIK